MPRKHKYSSNRTTYTKEQIAYMEALLDDAERRKSRVNWKAHQHEIGHTLSSIQSMASILRHKRYERDNAAQMRMIRNLMEAITEQDVPARSHNGMPLPKLVLDAERVTTSTQHLQFAAEMRNRIDPRNITAGVFGDPPPGRSALDMKRAGIVDTPRPRYGRPESKWTL